jgi:UDP-N-acetylglucosamine:LPS N-acetylglucosamine transferase
MRVLYVSGSVGLGHVKRDVAIARELQKIRPDVELTWLATDPATKVLEEEGMRLLPESGSYAADTKLMEGTNKGGHQLVMTDWLYEMDRSGASKDQFKHFNIIAAREKPDLVVADEAYELATGYTDNPNMERPPIIFLWDFIKMYPSNGGIKARMVTHVLNKYWDRALKLTPKVPWGSIFLGDIEDIPDEKLGWGMLNARQAMGAQYKIAGNPVYFDTGACADKNALRKELGYSDGHLILCSAGGTNIGSSLLQRCIDAYPLIRSKIGDARMIVVQGPHGGNQLQNVPEGVEVRGYVKDLYKHMAAADINIVQGGGSTTLELAILQKPFIYFPLKGHSEQEISVARKLVDNNIGIRRSFDETPKEKMAELVAENIDKPVNYPKLSCDGCRNAARFIDEFAKAWNV